jgi:beta-glucosidase
MKTDFIWGAGTSAYQIEGAVNVDGRTPSIWDVFSHKDGKIDRGHTGDIACDHYHRYVEDVALLAKLGVKAYRFSISWNRILPNGTGRVNPQGFVFYDCLLDELEKYHIEPYITLYHWDLPQILFEKGGWLNPEIPHWFEHYVDVVTKHFGNRVKNYITINEPQCIVQVGMHSPEHAPGVVYSTKECLLASHHLLLAHGFAVRIIRKNNPTALVGFAPCSNSVVPVKHTPAAIEAARSLFFKLPKDNFYAVTLFSDPVFLGDYPKEYYEIYKDDLPFIGPDDLKIISSPIDYCYQNVYTGTYCDIDAFGRGFIQAFAPGSPQANIVWEDVVPETTYWTPKFLYERYHKPIFIGENGMCCHDAISKDGAVHDPNRIDYMDRYLTELSRASHDGIEIVGYFAWSLLDNFEWAWGYTKRFGIVFVDFITQKRIPKDSYYFYQHTISTNGKNLK